jgi:succinate dehydrogenase / fumarate reductase, iron-sulfur subunit
MADKTITLKILRRDTPEARSRWETFRIPYRPNLNVISCLMEVRRNPVTASGDKTTPVAWEQNCLENVCGSCSMLINGKPAQACATLVDKVGTTIELRPLTKFPVVRDLVVDRTPMFEALKRVKAWVPIDGTHDLGPGPTMSEEEQAFRYALSECMTCGCCMEACPNYNAGSEFIGPAPVAQAQLFLIHPTGRLHQTERRRLLMQPGGINDCGNAQNCVRVCPKNVPLTDAIADMYRETTIQWMKDLFGR